MASLVAFLVVYSWLANDRMHCMNDHNLYVQRAIELATNVPDFPFGTVKPVEINVVGFMLGNKKAGPFKLEVEWIQVERAKK
jgi:hypothetical protein